MSFDQEIMSTNSPSIVVDLVGLLNGKKEEGVGLLVSTKTRKKSKRGKKASVLNGIKAPTAPDCDSDSVSEEADVSVSTNGTIAENKTTGLSNDWRKIFATSRKTAPNSPKKSASSNLSRKNGANSPKRSAPSSPRRSAPNSPRRSTPNSPRRTNSPKRMNSSRSVGQRPLKRSLNHSLEMYSASSQSIAKEFSRVTFDTAPFTGLLHVKQKDLDDPFWHLSPSTGVPHREIQQPELKTPNGNIAMSQVTNAGGKTTNVQFKLCSECEREATLTQLCQNHPQTDIRALYSRYHSLTTHTSQHLKCSIHIKLKHKDRIQVDHSFYPRSLPPVILGEHMHNEVWSDVYRPRKTGELIGNRLACTQLRDWLQVWKDKCTCTPTPPSFQSSTSKAKRKPLQSKSNTSTAWCVKEKDDDFVSLEHIRVRRGVKRVLSKVTSDSEEEDGNASDDNGGVCSAALVCGPHGCGKTAGVYAIAEELGFKVYEVNSGSVRSKAQLLSSLREATLSHQVTVGEKSSHPLNGLNGVTSSGGGGGGLMSFFRKFPKESKSVALESTTVILLDEVDVLFESDRGFWTAVNELLSVTKRPFIMTCSGVDFDLDCDHVKIVFDFPPIADVSLHIQVLSLVHGVSISAQSAHHLAKSLKCDLRKILNFLHTHLSGSCSLASFKPHPSRSTSHMETEESNNSQSTLAELRMAVDQADTVASIDVLTSGESTTHHHHSPWWRKTPMDSLVDELSENNVILSLSDASIYLRDILQVQSHSNRSLKEYNRAKELHTSQKKCAVLFSHHMWTLSHIPLVTEGLPFVRMICDAENARQTSNTSRRFRHYFKPFPIDRCDLQNFNDISKYLY